jgi:hypothetical protein
MLLLRPLLLKHFQFCEAVKRALAKCVVSRNQWRLTHQQQWNALWICQNGVRRFSFCSNALLSAVLFILVPVLACQMTPM